MICATKYMASAVNEPKSGRHAFPVYSKFNTKHALGLKGLRLFVQPVVRFSCHRFPRVPRKVKGNNEHTRLYKHFNQLLC